LLLLVLSVYAITYNTNFNSDFKNGTKYISWNDTIIEKIKNDIYTTNMFCDVNYVSGSQFPYQTFGFLPFDMISYMTIKPEDWCKSIFLDKYKYEEMCKQFNDDLNNILHQYYFAFPEKLLNGIQMVNYIVENYGNLCMNYIMVSLQTANENNKWFWKLLLDYANFNCYDTTSFINMFLDEPWRSDLNISTKQVLINGDYHTDNFGNISFTSGYVSYYTYYVARSNIIVC